MAENQTDYDVVPRCVAHGTPGCPDCSRITLDRLTPDGECRRGCSTYSTDGLHWDTCPNRLRGPVYATRDEALAALVVEGKRRDIRSALMAYATPASGPGWEALDQTIDRLMELTTSPD